MVRTTAWTAFGIAVLATADVFAFAPPTAGRFVRQTATLRRPGTSVRSSSSSDDDELSKLIGKRNKIVRKRSSAENADGGPESILEKIENKDLSEIDLDDVPAFETKRVARAPRKTDDDDGKNKSASASSKANEPAPVMDYTSDYNDENEFHIPNRIGFTTVAWGDPKSGFVTKKKLGKQEVREGKFNTADLKAAYDTLVREGVLLIDTSPEYGAVSAARKLSAEHIIGACIKETQDAPTPIVAGTYPNRLWQRTSKGLVSSLSSSCDALDISPIELVQVKSIGWLPSAGLVNGMNEAVAEVGNANYAGVQNVSPVRMRRIADKLDSYGLILATNSFEFSITNRKKERWISACKALGVVPLITNPTDDGLASAKYTASNPSGGVAGGASKYSFSKLEKHQPLHSVLEVVAEGVRTRVKRENQSLKERNRGRYGGTPEINTDITPFQVAINYVIAKGGVPLPAVNNSKDANEVKGCLGWSLTDEEVAMLESAADLCK